MRLLIAEDDVPLATGLASLFDRAGYAVDRAVDGEQADWLLRTEHYDAVLLDLGLPRRDGLSLLREWRDDGLRVPVLILTARGRWPDKAAGFGAGADDYVVKPFEPREVLLRVQALIRRANGEASAHLVHGRLTLDPALAEVTVDGLPVDLTAQEYRLFATLLTGRGRVQSRAELAERAWGRDQDPDSNSIDVLIGRLRRKLPDGLIETVRGHGFLIRTP